MGSELARLQRTEFGEVSLCQKFERGQAFVSLPAFFVCFCSISFTDLKVCSVADRIV